MNSYDITNSFKFQFTFPVVWDDPYSSTSELKKKKKACRNTKRDTRLSVFHHTSMFSPNFSPKKKEDLLKFSFLVLF